MITLRLTEYDPAWPEQFEEHRRRIAAALGECAKRIEHIGSTSVPGLAAKPIVDIVVYGAKPGDSAVRAALESAGYHVTAEEPGHCVFEPRNLDAHVHLWSEPHEIERHLVFRDRLRAHPEDRALYEAVKRKLVERPWETSNHYAEAKTAVIQAITRRARGEDNAFRIEQFAQLLLSYVPPYARVLEIGAGEGLLARRLAGAGHDVVAIDTHLRSTFPILETTFEAYEAPECNFDCVAAQLVLHHASDLGSMLDKTARLLKSGGILAIDDYGWERSTDPQYRKERADLYTSEQMLAALRERFAELFYTDHAYPEGSAGDRELGFTFIGRSKTIQTR